MAVAPAVGTLLGVSVMTGDTAVAVSVGDTAVAVSVGDTSVGVSIGVAVGSASTVNGWQSVVLVTPVV